MKPKAVRLNPHPEKLVKTVNKYSEFAINLDDAKQILAEQKNAFYQRGHKSLGLKTGK